MLIIYNIIVNNKIDLNSFGKEDLSHITTEDYKKYITKLLPGLLEYIKKVHFSENMPKNHNICLPKINSKYLVIYDGKKWYATEKYGLLHKLVTKKITTLDNKCDIMENKNIIDEININSYNDFITEYCSGEDKDKKKIYDDIALLIFNNRDKIDNYDRLLK